MSGHFSEAKFKINSLMESLVVQRCCLDLSEICHSVVNLICALMSSSGEVVV